MDYYTYNTLPNFNSNPAMVAGAQSYSLRNAIWTIFLVVNTLVKNTPLSLLHQQARLSRTWSPISSRNFYQF